MWICVYVGKWNRTIPNWTNNMCKDVPNWAKSGRIISYQI